MHGALRNICHLGRRHGASLLEKSERIRHFLERRMALLAIGWILLTGVLAVLRLAHPAAPIHKLADAWTELLGYALVTAAPVTGYLLGLAAARGKALSVQMTIDFLSWGRWRRLGPEEARTMPGYGAAGFLASLLVGLLLNVVIRALEFFAAVPAMGAHAPAWGRILFSLMAADVAVFGFLYMVAFVMALRAVPLFPRMLCFVWLLDIVMQLYIARQLGGIDAVPPAVLLPLADLLHGNVTKVLISMLVWLPYLILSARVNLTYRHRLREPDAQGGRSGTRGDQADDA